MKKCALIRIYGIVQGVGMRYSVFRKAVDLGLCGYVKNVVDGSVEVVVEGDEKDILDLVDYIKSGVRWAQIDDMRISWQKVSGRFADFQITH